MQNFLQKIKPWWPVIIKSLLIILAICGLVASFKGGDFMSSSMLLYFTIQSNIWIAAIAAVFIVFDVQRILNKRESVANVWYIVKFTFTVAITLTFLVFSLMLTPWMISLGQAAYLTSLSNICLHNAVPILAMLDFFLFDFKFKTNKKSFLYGAIMPIYYLIFALICSFSGVDFGRGAKVPYFFLITRPTAGLIWVTANSASSTGLSF